MICWPALPGADELVLLPVALPPMLLASIGYNGDARHVELHWRPDHARVDWCDGELGLTGDSRGWRAFADHPRIARLLEPYERAQPDGGHYTLLADRWEQQLLIGQAEAISALVHSQPSQILADGIARGGTDEDMLDAVCARVFGSRVDDGAAREARRANRGRLVDWLDEHPA
jgi:hypothetical protein